jgi:hypothetical protein
VRPAAEPTLTPISFTIKAPIRTEPSTGVLTGAILGLATYLFTDTLNLRDSNQGVPPQNPHHHLEGPSPPRKHHHTTASALPSRPLFPQSIPTILEEEDEDSPFPGGGDVKQRGGSRVRRVGGGWSDESDGTVTGD